MAGGGFSRFFLSGDCHIRIYNTHNLRLADVQLCNGLGLLQDDAFLQVDNVFGFPSAEKGENISRRMIVYLDHFADQVDPNVIIQMISGYRSPNYNQNLRDRGGMAAKTSTHMDGMAIDFTFKGMNAKEMWGKIRHEDCCGIGYYHGNTLHLDAGRPRFWTTETSKVRTDASEHNRFIYLSTEYDRYRPGETCRLFFTSMSDFGFGVPTEIELVDENNAGKKTISLSVRMKTENGETAPAKSCSIVQSRAGARFLFATLPEKALGRFRIRVSFCQKTAELMPDFVLSNPIEIVK